MFYNKSKHSGFSLDGTGDWQWHEEDFLRCNFQRAHIAVFNAKKKWSVIFPLQLCKMPRVTN